MGTPLDWLSGKVTVTITGTPLTEVTNGESASITGGIGISNARNAGDYERWFIGGGVTAGEGLVGTGDVAFGEADDGYLVWTAYGGAGAGENLAFPVPPVEGHVGATYTKTVPIDLASLPPGVLSVNPWAIFRDLMDLQEWDHLIG